jgi:hypothetical protein
MVLIDGIEYDFDKMNDLNYVLGKMMAYLEKVGVEKSIRSQKFIRHLHILVAKKLADKLKDKAENIHFETQLKNKNVDLAIFDKEDLKISIAVRSQISSIKKNFTNNINSLQGEVVALKNAYPMVSVGVVYLLKRTDLEKKEDCLPYFLEQIPVKLLPILSNIGYPSKDRFDVGCIIIYDKDENGNIIIEDNLLLKNYSINTFIDSVFEVYSKLKPTSLFKYSELTEDKFIDFLQSK